MMRDILTTSRLKKRAAKGAGALKTGLARRRAEESIVIVEQRALMPVFVPNIFWWVADGGVQRVNLIFLFTCFRNKIEPRRRGSDK